MLKIVARKYDDKIIIPKNQIGIVTSLVEFPAGELFSIDISTPYNVLIQRVGLRVGRYHLECGIKTIWRRVMMLNMIL